MYSYKLYVIPGSHACRSAMLMLEHKRVPYRRVDIVTLLHPVVVGCILADLRANKTDHLLGTPPARTATTAPIAIQ